MVYTHLLMLLFGKLFRQIKDGWVLVKESIKIVRTYPALIVPLFVTWSFIALCVLVVRYTNTSSIVTLAAFFAVIYSLVLSCLLLLELMQQIETGSKLSLTQAIGSVIGKNALKAVPIALVWAVLWFILLLLTPKKRKEDTQASLNDAAATLSGANSPFGLGLELLKKLLRMFFFLTLPAIAWEGKGPIGGFKRAFRAVSFYVRSNSSRRYLNGLTFNPILFCVRSRNCFTKLGTYCCNCLFGNCMDNRNLPRANVAWFAISLAP
jgi:hypothetical protein